MSEEGYSGYENWETWNVSLWLSNDEGLYLQTIEIMDQNPPRYSEPAKAYFADEASEALTEFVDQLLDENVITDKISIHRVDWQEVMMDFVSLEKMQNRVVGKPEFANEITNWQNWFLQVERNPNGNYA